jgi:hypothetical protein
VCFRARLTPLFVWREVKQLLRARVYLRSGEHFSAVDLRVRCVADGDPAFAAVTTLRGRWREEVPVAQVPFNDFDAIG